MNIWKKQICILKWSSCCDMRYVVNKLVTNGAKQSSISLWNCRGLWDPIKYLSNLILSPGLWSRVLHGSGQFLVLVQDNVIFTITQLSRSLLHFSSLTAHITFERYSALLENFQITTPHTGSQLTETPFIGGIVATCVARVASRQLLSNIFTAKRL